MKWFRTYKKISGVTGRNIRVVFIFGWCIDIYKLDQRKRLDKNK